MNVVIVSNTRARVGMVGILTTKKRLVAQAQKSEHLSFGFFSHDVRHKKKKTPCGGAVFATTHTLFKNKKTCTFATDVGRRLRTTRTSLDVAISSVSVTAARFDAIKARTRRFPSLLLFRVRVRSPSYFVRLFQTHSLFVFKRIDDARAHAQAKRTYREC